MEQTGMVNRKALEMFRSVIIVASLGFGLSIAIGYIMGMVA